MHDFDLRDPSDYVCWVPRRFNASADHVANIGLDERSNFEWTEEAGNLKRYNRLIVSSDGGFRRGYGSASAWVIWKLDMQLKTAVPIALSHMFWYNGLSSFEAEVIALDSAISFCIDCLLTS